MEEIIMIKAGIIGATGYAGNEIVRLLLGHKDVEVAWYGSRSYIDQKYADVYQNFFKLVDAKCMDDNMEALADEVIKCKSDEDAKRLGIEWGIQQCKELYAAGFETIHFYTVSAVDSVKEIAKDIL